MDEVENFLNEYVEDCEYRKRLNSKTVRAYKTDLKQFFDFVEAEYLEQKKIIDYIHYLNHSYTKYKTIKRKIASVKGFFSYLEYNELIDKNPFRKIRTKIQEPNLLPKTIDCKVLEKIFNYLYSQIDEAKSEYKKINAVRNVAIIELLFCTGLRISELCNIRNTDIDLYSGNLKIFGKGSKERIIHIGNENVINILKQYNAFNSNRIEKAEWFFLNKAGGRLSDQSVRKMVNQIEVILDLPNHITPHMFRHTFATALLDKDVDIRYIQKILGHSSISVTQIYTHVSNIKQKEILINKNPRNDYQNYMK